MSKQVQDYISLKPIADRFKEVASTISDEEIKSLIKEELRNQIRDQVEFGSVISAWVEEMLEEDEIAELVRNSLVVSIKSKFR